MKWILEGDRAASPGPDEPAVDEPVPAEWPWQSSPVGERQVFFVTGAGRSGTTSAIRVLGEAARTAVVSEPLPRLSHETHLHRLGRLPDPRPILWQTMAPRIRAALVEADAYGEKDQLLYGCLTHLRELFAGRFLFVTRDGRDAVRSLVDVHRLFNGNLYREAGGELSPEVRQVSERVWSNPRGRANELYRPRPRPGDPWFDRWPRLTRFEMTAWLWSHQVRTTLAQLNALPDGCWTSIDYSAGLTAESFAPVYELFGLAGFDAGRVQAVLDSRVNSLAGKKLAGQASPRWPDWPAERRESFDAIAAAAMVELGYYAIDRLPGSRPPAAWAGFELDPEPDPLPAAVWRQLDAAGAVDPRGLGKTLLVGADLSLPEEARVRRFPGGSLGAIPAGEFDTVILSGVIDRLPDMDGFLVEMARRAGGRLISIAGRGAFPGLIEHAHARRPGGAYANRWSSSRSRNLLARALGFSRTRSGVAHLDDGLRPELAWVVAER